MEYLIVGVVAVVASLLSLFSGFGLGTLLLPAFALFFPVPEAVAATAIVHLATNLFKTGLVGRQADWGVVLRFAMPGALAAFAGAALLGVFAAQQPLFSYSVAGSVREVTLVNLVIGVLIGTFALVELSPWFSRLTFDRKYLPVGGIISGFFGGLSGHQGAFRSAFLIKAGLDKQAFIGTSAVSSVIVDLSRLLVYGVAFLGVGVVDLRGTWRLVIAASLAAFAGAYLGSRYLHKLTLHGLRVFVAVLVALIGVSMASGLI